MKKRIFSLLLCLCMVFALLPVTVLAAAGESDVDITVTLNATTAKVKSSRMEVESVSWSGSTVTIKVKIKDNQPFTVFAKDVAKIYVTVNNKQTKSVQRVDDKHIVVVFTFSTVTVDAADPSRIVIPAAHTKEEMNAKWEECRPMYEGSPYVTAPSVTAPYSIGTLADAALVDALNYLNYARYSVGLPAVTLDATLQKRAQHGAVLMAAVQKVSHTNPKPGNMSQEFYQQAYASTTHSNVCSQRVELQVLNNGLLYQLSDATPGNIAQVGHRRWLLNPKLAKAGFGVATGKNGILYHATECHDVSGPNVSYEAICWPAPGYQTIQQFNANDPFTASLNPNIYDATKLSEIKATVTVTQANGREASYTLDASKKNASGEYFNIVTNDGVGSGFTVIFRPMFTRTEGVKAEVELSGLYKKGAATPVTLCWETEFFYPEYYNLTDMELSDQLDIIEAEMQNSAEGLIAVADDTVTEADLVRAAIYPVRDNRQLAFVGTRDFSKTANPSGEGYSRITTTIDLTYHGNPFSVTVTSQIMIHDPGGEKGAALAEIKAALKAAGSPTLGSEAKAIAQPIAEAHGLTLTSCEHANPSVNDNKNYKGLRKYRVNFKTGEGKTSMGWTTISSESFYVTYDDGKGLGVYLPLGTTQLPAVGALTQKTDNIPAADVPPLNAAELPTVVTDPEPSGGDVSIGGSVSGSKSLTKLSQMEIAALVKGASDTLTAAPFETQPSVKAPYATGKVAASALQAAADRLTLLRRLAGLPAVELDATLNEQAQYGAVLLAASEFSHTPAKPAGMDDDFYQKGSDATNSSNLHYYASSGKAVTYVLAQAPDALMDDSDSSNVARVGHRRWQLNPTLKKVGFGLAVAQTGGMTEQYVTEKIYDTSGSTGDYDFIAWPASGNFPNDLEAFNKNTAWSVTLNPSLYAKPEQMALTVTLKRNADGKTWTFSGGESTAADSGKYFGVDTTGRGVPNCIIFRPDGVSKYEGAYSVDIAGLFTTAGETANLHYEVNFFDSNNPQAAAPAIPANGTAYPSTQTVDLDGKKVEFQMYALKDQNGNPTNYVKVRDLALALSGTKAQFSVDWNGAVNLVAGTAYKANGSENKTPFSGNRAYTVPTSPTSVNGAASDLTAIFLVDDAGGGYTYYQLRDLGRKLGFNVDWSAEKGVFIETDKPYSSK